MSMDCVFCKIAEGKIPAPRIYEDDRYFAIRDIRPHARQHFLVIPKEHVASLEAAFPLEGDQYDELVAGLMAAGTRVAREQGLLPKGFRAVINNGPHAGQTVFHIHLHVLGGEPLSGGFGA